MIMLQINIIMSSIVLKLYRYFQYTPTPFTHTLMYLHVPHKSGILCPNHPIIPPHPNTHTLMYLHVPHKSGILCPDHHASD